MKNYKEEIKKLSNERIIDIIQNYKKYNYSEEMKKYSILILKSRNINQEIIDNILSKNKINDDYKKILKRIYNKYKNTSITYSIIGISDCFILFFTLLFFKNTNIFWFILSFSFIFIIVLFILILKNINLLVKFYEIIDLINNKNYRDHNKKTLSIHGILYYISNIKKMKRELEKLN